jgi:protein-S-isoprenylcysteine O-methyltransferase Ste14
MIQKSRKIFPPTIFYTLVCANILLWIMVPTSILFNIPSTLITTGPFSFSKHPMYVGMGFILFGESILLGSLVTFLIPIIFIVIIRKLLIPLEERTLKTWFSDEYEQYEQKMRWWN